MGIGMPIIQSISPRSMALSGVDVFERVPLAGSNDLRRLRFQGRGQR